MYALMYYQQLGTNVVLIEMMGHMRHLKFRVHMFVFAITYVCIYLTYTTHNLNNKYPSITCSYIQEYLGYQSNNLYFLFSHSWPVYNLGQVQHTNQVERKTKFSKKNGEGSFGLPCDICYGMNDL